jgi:DNA-binding MarR family transcriptional regulator
MMTMATEERSRRRRVVLNEKNIIQKLALKSRPVHGMFVRDKVDGAVDLTFSPEDGRDTMFRLTAEQAEELRAWLNDTAHFAQVVK